MLDIPESSRLSSILFVVQEICVTHPSLFFFVGIFVRTKHRKKDWKGKFNMKRETERQDREE